jgi:3-ketosteroid 9alpha-monooxygenase subunit B
VRAPEVVGDHEEIRRGHGFHTLSVKRVVPETRDTKSYVLAVPDELSSTFSYTPGQFCTFRVRVGDGEHLRSYSMSSAPGIDADLTVTVKRVPGGKVSNWFHDQVTRSSTLEVTKPAGTFCPRSTDVPVVGLCAGSGVTPIMSIAKSVVHRPGAGVRLLYANRDPDSVIFGDALRDLRVRHPARFDVLFHFDSRGGYVTAEEVARFADPSLDAHFYVCGPGPFMDVVAKKLEELGVGPERILIERFEATKPLPPSPEDTQGVASDSRGMHTADSETPETVTLLLKGNSTTIRYRPGDTVLETARRAGMQPPFSCEAGNCATCMAVVREGAATMRANNALTPDEVDEGWVLTCQAMPRSRRLVVEYESL